MPTGTAAALLALQYQFERSERFSPSALAAHQLRQAAVLLQHAQATVPWYRETLAGRSVAREMAAAEWLDLPTLDRTAVQAEFERLRSGAVPPSHGKVHAGQTSGSTARPIRFLSTDVSQLIWQALTLREHLWHRRDFAGKLAAIRIKVDEGRYPNWGAPVAAVCRTGPAATLNVHTDVAAQLDWLLREDPDYLITHPSNLGALAELALVRGVRPARLRQARTYSEALRPGLRERVQAAFGVGIADTYSCEEAGYIALQCPEHDHYHVQSESLLVEVLDERGRPCGPGETGEVVLTTLHNFAMPLIRYRLGDYAEVGEACPCGRGLPVLKRIHGRQRNMIVLPDGRRHWPSFPAELWRAVAPVEQFRLVQKTREDIEAQYVMARPLAPDEEMRLAAALQERLGYPFRIVLRRMDAIQRGANHKFEDFISELPAS